MNALKPCGTNAAFYRHHRAGEPPCDACVEATRIYNRSKYWKDRPFRPSTRTRIGDIFDIYDNKWMTPAQLHDELEMRFPGETSLASVRRTLFRMRDRGETESIIGDDGWPRRLSVWRLTDEG